MVKVRAVKQGFINGSRVREDVVFDLPDEQIKRGPKGEIVKPSWVVDASTPKKEKPPVMGDTKPIAAQKAVRAKTAPEALV